MAKHKPWWSAFKHPSCSDQSFAGRPVFKAGTFDNAAKNALSFKLLSSLIPARKISLFLTLCLRPNAFCLSAAMAWYSSLGKVKLSRTNFGFLVLASATGLALGFAVVFALGLGLAGACVVVLVTGFLAVTDLALTGALRVVLLAVLPAVLGAALRTAFLTLVRLGLTRLAGVAATTSVAGVVAGVLVAVFSVAMISMNKS